MILITVTSSEPVSASSRGKYIIKVKLSSETHEEERSFLIFRYFLKNDSFHGEFPCTGDFLSAEKFDALTEAEEATRASVKAVDFLAYGDQTAGVLRDKLRRKGFSAAAAEAAVGFMTEKRYLREDEQLIRLMQQMCERKKYGIRRIRQEIYQKKFSREAIEAVYEDTLPTLDFDAALDARMEKLDIDAFSDPAYRKKQVASLLRYGFTPDEIQRAIRRARQTD